MEEEVLTEAEGVEELTAAEGRVSGDVGSNALSMGTEKEEVEGE